MRNEKVGAPIKAEIAPVSGVLIKFEIKGEAMPIFCYFTNFKRI